MDEVPAGLNWPPPGVQLARTEEALTIITRLLRGETVSCRGAIGESVSDCKYKMMAVLSADPGTHVRQVKAMQAMGATAVVVMKSPGADALGTMRLYGEHVLPQLRT